MGWDSLSDSVSHVPRQCESEINMDFVWIFLVFIVIAGPLAWLNATFFSGKKVTNQKIKTPASAGVFPFPHYLPSPLKTWGSQPAKEIQRRRTPFHPHSKRGGLRLTHCCCLGSSSTAEGRQAFGLRPNSHCVMQPNRSSDSTIVAPAQ
jgi:hypothetical protein